jgi:hypothetical protein
MQLLVALTHEIQHPPFHTNSHSSQVWERAPFIMQMGHQQQQDCKDVLEYVEFPHVFFAPLHSECS